MTKVPLKAGLIALLFLFSFVWAGEQTTNYSATENKLLAAFILNVAKLTEWNPASSSQAIKPKIRLLVADNDALASELRQLTQGKKITNHETEVQTGELTAIDSKSGEQAEVVILIPDSSQNLKPALKKLKGCRCLAVTYEGGMALHGASVNFFTEDSRLRFEINVSRVKEENLELSSQLLKLGKRIE